MINQNQKRQQFIIYCLLDELEKKTKWEKEFIYSIAEKVVNKIPLSYRQNSKLEQIWRK